MNWRAMRLPMVVGFGLIFLAAGLAAQSLYQEYFVRRPLAEAIQHLAGVQKVAVQAGDPVAIRLWLGPDADLPYVLRRVREITLKRAGMLPGSTGSASSRVIEPRTGRAAAALVEIVDRRTPRLLAAYERLQFDIQEAMATGRFTRLPAAARAEARRAGLGEARVWVDEEYVYVRLQERKVGRPGGESGGGWLYGVIPRRPGGGTGVEA